MPDDGGAFGQDGDAAFALQIVAVHRAFSDLLVFAEDARLAKQGVHERRFAVVNVGDDGDITESHKKKSKLKGYEG